LRCLVDKSVPNAQVYYEKYLREPSPAGDITIATKDLLATDDMDLKLVLAEMKALGAKGEMLVVTHSNPKGLLMKLMKGGGVSAEFGVMEKILEISDGIRRREAIRSVSGRSPKAKAWQEWYRKFDPGIRLEDGYEQANDNWEQYVEQKYEEWYQRQGTAILKLPGGKKDLGDFIKLVDDVRKTGFARLEFRACRIGTDKDSLKKIAQFLNVKKVVAPKEIRTFYAHVSGIDVVTAKEFAGKVKTTANARKFGNIELLLIIGEKSFRAFATHADHGKAFVKAYVSSGYTGGVSPFVFGGLEPTGKSLIAGKKHVFPLETDYKGLLTTYDGP
jgi:hypothetical protein